jgi:hypothetical protein
VPASKRLVFKAGIEIVQAAFVAVFFRTIVPWIVKRKWAQEHLVRWTERRYEGLALTRGIGGNGRLAIGAPDEL